MPPDTIYVGRPTKWGNPYRIEKRGEAWFVIDPQGHISYDQDGYNYKETAATIAVSAYSLWLETQKQLDLSELAGKNLACFCEIGQPCHVEVLLEKLKSIL